METNVPHPCFNFLSSTPPFTIKKNPISNDITCHCTSSIVPNTPLFILDIKYIILYENIIKTPFSIILLQIMNHIGIKVFKEVILWLNMIVLLHFDEYNNKEDQNLNNYRIYLRSLNDTPPNLSSWSTNFHDQLIGTSIYNTLDKQKSSQQVPGSISIINEILYLLNIVRDHYKNNEKAYSKYCPFYLNMLIGPSCDSIFTEKSLSWARGHYLSRRFSHPTFFSNDPNISKVQIKGELIGYGEHIGVFVPILDLFNHSTSNASCVVQYDESITNNPRIIVSSGEIKLEIGDEITFKYGSFSNEKLLHAYGFCINDNIDDEVTFAMRSSEGSFGCNIKRGGIDMIPKEMWQFLSGGDLDDSNVEISINELSMLYQFIEMKLEMLNKSLGSPNTCSDDYRLNYIKIYVSGQREIYSQIKKELTDLLDNFEDDI